MNKTAEENFKSYNFLLITGVSGAGKSSALKALEDIGFEAIDNVPISLLERLVTPSDLLSHLAIGVDIRTRDFDENRMLSKIDSLAQQFDLTFSILFLDCLDEILLRRFAETRRRHPLAIDRPVIDGLRHERGLLKKIKSRADIIIDTSDMVLSDMKSIISSHFTTTGKRGLSIFINSFGYRNGLPRTADLVFDVRFLRNPHYDINLRALDGRDKDVTAYITNDEKFPQFYGKLIELLEFLLEQYESEGKNYLTIAFGCTGGKHRSVFLAEKIALWLKKRDQLVIVRHRDLEKTEN